MHTMRPSLSLSFFGSLLLFYPFEVTSLSLSLSHYPLCIDRMLISLVCVIFTVQTIEPTCLFVWRFHSTLFHSSAFANDGAFQSSLHHKVSLSPFGRPTHNTSYIHHVLSFNLLVFHSVRVSTCHCAILFNLQHARLSDGFWPLCYGRYWWRFRVSHLLCRSLSCENHSFASS